MTGFTFIRNGDSDMVRVQRLVIVRLMARKAYCRRAGIPVHMAKAAFGVQMGARKGKTRIIVIKAPFG